MAPRAAPPAMRNFLLEINRVAAEFEEIGSRTEHYTIGAAMVS
jgi:hypothetical protein